MGLLAAVRAGSFVPLMKGSLLAPLAPVYFHFVYPAGLVRYIIFNCSGDGLYSANWLPLPGLLKQHFDRGPVDGFIVDWMHGRKLPSSGKKQTGVIFFLITTGWLIFPGFVSLWCAACSILREVLKDDFEAVHTAALSWRVMGLVACMLGLGTVYALFSFQQKIVEQDYESLIQDSEASSSSHCRALLSRYLWYIEFGVVFCFAILWFWVFLTPLCGLISRCGCTWIWTDWDALGIQNCNVHNPSGPRCPFCTATTSTAWIPQWAGAFIAHKWGRTIRTMLVWPLVFVFGYFGTSIVIAYIFIKATNYPYFLTGPIHPKKHQEDS